MNPRDIAIDPHARLYRQEGNLGLFQIMIPYISTVGDGMKKYLGCDYGSIFGFFKKDYGQILLNEDNMQAIAKSFLRKAKDGVPQEWLVDWKKADAALTESSRKISNTDLRTLSDTELKRLYDQHFKLDLEMWHISIFIDAFDPGHDTNEITRIQQRYNFSDDEVHILLAPEEPSYIMAWEIGLNDLKRKKLSLELFKNKFFWFKCDYTSWQELTDAVIDAGLKTITDVEFVSPLLEQRAVLDKHNLKHNPLVVFKQLMAWRDERKRLNFTGLYGLIRILREIMRRKGIDMELFNGLLPQQVEDLFAGHIAAATIKRQWEEGVLVGLTSDGVFNFEVGHDAERKWKNVLKQIDSEHSEEVRGFVASRGYAKGEVRVVLTPTEKEFKRMQEGDILVSVMTRPEFLPLMKRAGAIVTDEGGISCHAAIVARELRKPCVIGTRNATKILRDGDLVEVDAEKGIVRKI